MDSAEMTLSPDDALAIDALTDTLLPGGDGFPAASAVGIGAWIAARGEYADAMREIVALLPRGFHTLAPEPREAEARNLEARQPIAFERFVQAAYAGYYTSLPVLSVIEEATGYHARPQPFGYAPPAFDDAIVSVPRRAPPSWRDLPPA
jgi:hypothetical protein